MVTINGLYKIKEIKEQLIKLENEMNGIFGKLPDEMVQEDLFTEFDLGGTYVHFGIEKLEKEGKITWDIKTLDDIQKRLKEFKDKMSSKFKDNPIVIEHYNKLMKTIKLMKEIKKVV